MKIKIEIYIDVNNTIHVNNKYVFTFYIIQNSNLSVTF